MKLLKFIIVLLTLPLWMIFAIFDLVMWAAFNEEAWITGEIVAVLTFQDLQGKIMTDYKPKYSISPNGVGHMKSSEIAKTESFKKVLSDMKKIKKK